MNSFFKLTKRNTKLFFKDKGMFFSSLITPLILLVLFITFLGKVFKETFLTFIPEGLNVSESVIDALAGGQLFSSLLAVSCITVAFCSNMLMVQDKISGAKKDFLITPVKKSTLAVSYYFSSLISTLIISFVATIACFIYIACIGWYMSLIDCLLIFFDVILLTMFGTALSSVVNHFLTSQGQVSAVSGIVSSMYGFISGAYMPIATFGVGIQKILMFLPGTYGTALIRNHTIRGALSKLQASGMPIDAIEKIKDGIDMNLYFFGNKVSISTMYLVLILSIILLIGIYVLINLIKFKKHKNCKK